MSKVKSLIWQEIKLIQFTSKQAAKIADNFFFIYYLEWNYLKIQKTHFKRH